jgi:ankyrin repeat protein
MESFQNNEIARICTYLQNDPWHNDEFDRNCLHYAMMYRDARLQDILAALMTGININQMDCLGETPITLLLKSGNHRSHTEINELLQLLLMAGADPNLCGPHDPSPILLATMTRNFHAMVYLILYGANLNTRYSTPYETIIPNNTTPLSFAATHRDEDMLEILMKSGLMTPETIFAALQKTDSDLRHLMLN